MYVDKIFTIMNDSELTLKLEVVDSIKSHNQSGILSESGGILLGTYYKSGKIVIGYNSTPYPKDIRSITGFKRRDEGHLEFYHEYNSKSEGKISYVGDWHTHPSFFSIPSYVDKLTWKKSLKYETENGLPLFFIILCNNEISVWMGDPHTKTIKKLKEKINEL